MRRILFLALLLLPGIPRAGILNTLRCWHADENGWYGNLGGGASISSGNTRVTSIEVGGLIQFKSNSERIRLMASDFYQSVEGERAAEDFVIHLRHNHRLSENISTLLFAQNQYSPFQRLERRSLLGAGVTFDIYRDSSFSVFSGSSIMLEDVELTGDQGDETELNTRGSFFVSILWKPARALSVDLSGFYQPKLRRFNDPAILGSLALQTEVTRIISMVSSLDYEFDSTPPDGVDKEDIKFSTGFNIGF